jgi:hypothetical protein
MKSFLISILHTASEPTLCRSDLIRSNPNRRPPKITAFWLSFQTAFVGAAAEVLSIPARDLDGAYRNSPNDQTFAPVKSGCQGFKSIKESVASKQSTFAGCTVCGPYEKITGFKNGLGTQ